MRATVRPDGAPVNKIESRIVGTDESELITLQEFYVRLYREPDGPSCCGGAGYVRKERPVGHPDFGGYQRCPACYPSQQQPEGPAPWSK